MPPKIFKNSIELGNLIKTRRNELNLTIEGAAKKAGIGTKTWGRYESGASIRKDMVRGICNALKWKTFPENGDTSFNSINFDEYKKSEAWSSYLEKRFGKYVALSFVSGSAWLLDGINEDLDALSKMPRGSHIGEISKSFISSILPQQFLVRYDYEFMYMLRQKLIWFREIAHIGKQIIAHSVLDELVLYLIEEESEPFMEELEIDFDTNDEDDHTDWRGWAFDIFDDMDIVTYLYDDLSVLPSDDTYHFDNWIKQQFYVQEEE